MLVLACVILLLFLLAFNPIFHVPRSSSSSLVGYTDDLTYHRAIFGEEDLAEARSDLDELSAWIAREGFHLQTAKTKFVKAQNVHVYRPIPQQTL